MDVDFDSWLAERRAPREAADGRLPPGTSVGGFTVEALLGRGGFAEVYRAHAADGAPVAVKILHRLDEQSRLRFDRETDILTQLSHPGIPRLIASGTYQDRPFLVMELLEARDLPHNDRAVAAMVCRICNAASALHAMGYVHRDIKPSNILWRDRTPVLTDFGLVGRKSDSAVSAIPSEVSVVDGQRVIVGTVGYAAPEQLAGGRIDETTDVHAIGMLADACFGRQPPACWRRIIDCATNSRSATRYPSAAKLSRQVRRRHHRRMLFSLVAVIISTILAYILYGWVQSYHAENRPPIRFQEE